MPALLNYVPLWLREWAAVYLGPLLKLGLRRVALILLQGGLDAILLLGLPVTLITGSQVLWENRYTLTATQQEQVARWAEISAAVARLEDVPPVVPLVLWLKEGGLHAVNPANCEGIMGLHTAVTTGQLPCFSPGPLTPQEIARQLQLGAAAFKAHCPEVHYTTTDPEVLRRCYLYYNAGRNTRLIPDLSGYVMNGYDAAHQNMLHVSEKGEVIRLQALGAWPAHLAIQAQVAGLAHTRPPLLLPTMLTLQEANDRLWTIRAGLENTTSESTELPRCRTAVVRDCFVVPHSDGDPNLRPLVSPLPVAIARAGPLNCETLPGVDLEASEESLVLAPMPGQTNRYTDQWGNLTLQIDNDEWTVWLMGLRSYAVAPGTVQAQQPVGAIGGAGSATPLLHVAILDKVNHGFVDPVAFLPQGSCPALFQVIQSNRENREEAMNIWILLPFGLTILAAVWALWLIFKKDLLSKGLVQVIVYFLGVLIVLAAVGLIVDNLIPGWFAQRLRNAQQSEDLRAIVTISSQIVEDSTGGSAPTVAPIFPTTPPQANPTLSPQATPAAGDAQSVQPRTGERTHTVASGDTLTNIALRYGVSRTAIQQRNNIADPNRIQVGQQLIIPAP